MKRIVLLFTLLFIVLSTTAQKQASIWYFGNNAGLKFQNNKISEISGGQTGLSSSKAIEGTSTICDSAGNLLFYSAGEYIWNRDNNIMFNGTGINSHTSSTQGSIIVPKPNSNHLFYLFTLDAAENELKNGLSYSVIDMRLDSCRGGVLRLYKNIPLLTEASEKIAVIQHSNNTDYWIVAHHFGTNDFHVFLLTKSGITDEVITSIGPISSQSFIDYYQSVGQMKASSDGKKVAYISANSNPLFELFDFDNTTGRLSNHISIRPTQLRGNFSLEFSPNGQFIYTSNNKNEIYQFDISSGDSAIIRKSLVTMSAQLNGNHCIFQLGVDGKIYFNGLFDGKSISVINNPNLKGKDCNIINDYFFLNTGQFRWGFNQTISGFKYTNGIVDCFASPATGVTTNSNSGIYNWSPNKPIDSITQTTVVNAFTPNGDGLNDVFSLVTNTPIYAFHMTIYNRWGEKLYETNNINQGWDGTYQNTQVISGNYLYTIWYRKTENSPLEAIHGTVHLLR